MLPAILKTVDDGLAIPLFFKHALPLDDGACAEIYGRGFGIDAESSHRGTTFLDGVFRDRYPEL
jgi:hypothetical protein